jgi:cell wall assembly regulator SMI1
MTSRRSGSPVSIIRSLRTIEAHLARLRRPVMQLLQPGLSREQIEKHEAKLQFKLTPDLVNLYRVRNGTAAREGDIIDDLWFFPGFYLLSLEEAVQTSRQRRR